MGAGSAHYLKPLLSGVALWLAFPNFPFFPLAWVALVPHLDFLSSRPSWSRMVVGHFLMAGVYFGGILYWIPGVLTEYGQLNTVVALALLILMVAALAVFLLPFSLIVRAVASSSQAAALALAPGAWVVTEIARNYWAVNGFPWAALGYSQTPYPCILQMADLTGIYGVSFVLVLVSAALTSLWRLKRWALVLVAVVVLAAVHLYAIYRLDYWEPPGQGTLQVALVQPDLRLFAGREYYAVQYFEKIPAMVRESVREGARWVILPEAPNPYYYPEDFYFRTFWSRLSRSLDIWLMFNATTTREDDPGRYYNSAVLIGPDGEEKYRYDKVHLVPFGEYVPFQGWARYFAPLVEEVSSYTPGERVLTGPVADWRIGTLICYEAIFPELARQAVDGGAQLLVNLTNDAWYGRTAAPDQHLQIARVRSIETRKPLLRCANSGYTAVIDHAGRVKKRLPLFTEGTLHAEVAPNSYQTVYSRWGDWVNIVLLGSNGLLAWQQRRRPRHRRRRSRGRT